MLIFKIFNPLGSNLIKNFTALIYGFLQSARAFVHGIQPSLMFVGKARAYPRVEHLKGAMKCYCYVVILDTDFHITCSLLGW
jgi:hypothetical protein